MKEENHIINGFSKLEKEEKLRLITSYYKDPETVAKEFAGYWHDEERLQNTFDEFSENTVTNFYMPFSVAPNFLINGKKYIVPMVIEESSVVAAASKSAKFWSGRGGFTAEVVTADKVGQVHFLWHGDTKKLSFLMPELNEKLKIDTERITANMQKRGGGIKNIELIDMTEKEKGYYQLNASFDTCDSMGANFINSCLEEFAKTLKQFLASREEFEEHEREADIIMCILSNYTPECLVRVKAECPIAELGTIAGFTPHEFAERFAKAVKIAKISPYRAVTHNKGIFNGIDAVVLATGNDFRAVEACGHAYASRSGSYSSLTDVSIDNDTFSYELTVPLALGVVGGLTHLHPLASRSLELLGNPNAQELMMITASVGLANNFGAVKSLITTGIQQGHMKMHLLNIMNGFNATEDQKKRAKEYFKNHTVTVSTVREFLQEARENAIVF